MFDSPEVLVISIHPLRWRFVIASGEGTQSQGAGANGTAKRKQNADPSPKTTKVARLSDTGRQMGMYKENERLRKAIEVTVWTSAEIERSISRTRAWSDPTWVQSSKTHQRHWLLLVSDYHPSVEVFRSVLHTVISGLSMRISHYNALFAHYGHLLL